MKRKRVLTAVTLVLFALGILLCVAGSCTVHIQFTKDFRDLFMVDDREIQLTYGDMGEVSMCNGSGVVKIWGINAGHGLFSLKIPVKFKENEIVLYCKHFKSNNWYKSRITVTVDAKKTGKKEALIHTDAEWRDIPLIGKKKKLSTKKVVALDKSRDYDLIQTGD